jgi:hypothetical protein
VAGLLLALATRLAPSVTRTSHSLVPVPGGIRACYEPGAEKRPCEAAGSQSPQSAGR